MLAREFDEGVLYGSELIDFVTESYAAMKPFMKFLCESQGARL